MGEAGQGPQQRNGKGRRRRKRERSPKLPRILFSESNIIQKRDHSIGKEWKG